MGVLSGIRVLDFGRYIAGPLCAAMLGDHGADVIRIEKVDGGEDRYLYPVTDAGDGALFLQMNRNKRGITLDPRVEGGAKLLRRLVRSADVVIANLPAETLRTMGLDYESLRSIRPDIILTSISAFGSEGPYAERVGFDGIGQAMSGSAWLSGPPGQPTKAFASWVDFSTALNAAFATLVAIHHRQANGAGQHVDCNLFATAATVMNFPLIEQALTGRERAATGNRAQSGGPADFFRTQDGWITVQVIGAPLFKRWARLMEEPSWLADERFATDAKRADNGAILSERMASWCEVRTSEEALRLLAGARIPAGPILSPAGVLADEHVKASGMLTPMAYPGAASPAPMIMSATHLGETPAAIHRRPPMLGEHADFLLAELGYAPAEVAALRAAGTI